MSEASFTREEKLRIVESIRKAEKNTSGEIRVHIENRCKEDVLDRAAGVFDLLGLQQTKFRNGVLFYLALKDRKFAILGDAGINEKTGEDFWTEIKVAMENHFRQGNFTNGLSEGIEMAGRKLAEHFPYDQKGDLNELSDEISFGK